jgi:hypothetical protein
MAAQKPTVLFCFVAMVDSEVFFAWPVWLVSLANCAFPVLSCQHPMVFLNRDSIGLPHFRSSIVLKIPFAVSALVSSYACLGFFWIF